MSERRPMQRLVHSTERLENHHRLLGVLLLAVAALLTYVSIIAINGVPFQSRYPFQAVVPADAPLLKDGDEVRVGGQRAGQVRAVEISADGALVSMELDEGPVGRDARATVRLRGLAGATYVAIDRGDVDDPLPANGRIPRSRTGTGVELADVVDQFDRDSRMALERTLETYGGGMVGRGLEINETLADLRPALVQGEPLLDAFTPAPGRLSDMVRGIRRTARGFAPPGNRELERLFAPANDTLDAFVARSGDLGAIVDRLPPFEDAALATLPEANLLLDDLQSTARDLNPGVRALNGALPRVNRLLASGDDLAELSRLAGPARPVLVAAEPLMVDLRLGAAALPNVARPLEPFAGFLAPYREEILLAPTGFTRWGAFRYFQGQASGSRAVRFVPVFTCHRARTPYPKPGEAFNHSEACSE